MHEVFDHTADLGLRIVAPDLDTLFAEAGECLFAAIVDDPSSVTPRFETSILLDGADPEYLMMDWLRHLLYLFESGDVYRNFEVKISGDGLTAIAFGEPFDRERHQLSREVKAITYHGLKVEQTADGWLAEVIVDI